MTAMVVNLDTSDWLRADTVSMDITLVPEPGTGALLGLGQVKGVEVVEGTDGATGKLGFPTYRVLGRDSEADLCPAIYDLARAEDWPVRELRQDVRTLESVFNELATTS